MPDPITYYNRATGELEDEAIYGEGFLRWAYGTGFGRATVWAFARRPLFSKWYGWRMSKPVSAEKIAPFLEEYEVDTAEFADSPESYASFNEFFWRKLKPEARPIAPGDEVAAFPADGRHLAVPELGQSDHLYVKGQRLDIAEFLGSAELGEKFDGGCAVLSRLCPTDYHRFHFPVSGEAAEPITLGHSLYSVSPLALGKKAAFLWENRRCLTLVESPTFGTVAVVEVGATCVGSILHSSEPGLVAKGDEKGYFAFGGSMVVTVFQKGRIQLESDLLEQAKTPREVYAKMGEALGKATAV